MRKYDTHTIQVAANLNPRSLTSPSKDATAVSIALLSAPTKGRHAGTQPANQRASVRAGVREVESPAIQH